MPFFRNKIVWSLVEVEYLKQHRKEDINQLSLALSKSRNAIKNKLLELDGKKLPTKASKKRTNIGKRKDLGVFMRSNWESNLARWFNYSGHTWQYEPQVFVFKGVKHGTVSYCPDFLIDNQYYVEVKGFLDGKSKTALRRFKKLYPEEFKRLLAVPGSSKTQAAKFFQELGVPIFVYYNELKKDYASVLPNWEE